MGGSSCVYDPLVLVFGNYADGVGGLGDRLGVDSRLAFSAAALCAGDAA